MKGCVRMKSETSGRRSLQKAWLASQSQRELIREPSHKASSRHHLGVAVVQHGAVEAELLPVDALGAGGDAENRGFSVPVEDDAGQHFPLGEGGAAQDLVKLLPHQACNCVGPAMTLFFSFLNASCQRMVANPMKMEQQCLACCQFGILLAYGSTLGVKDSSHHKSKNIVQDPPQIAVDPELL